MLFSYCVFSRVSLLGKDAWIPGGVSDHTSAPLIGSDFCPFCVSCPGGSGILPCGRRSVCRATTGLAEGPKHKVPLILVLGHRDENPVSTPRLPSSSLSSRSSSCYQCYCHEIIRFLIVFFPLSPGHV